MSNPGTRKRGRRGWIVLIIIVVVVALFAIRFLQVGRRGTYASIRSIQETEGKPVEVAVATEGDLEVWTTLAGTVEGCVICHAPHAATNRFMLKANRTSELCLTCHLEAPTFHNLADPRYQNCTTCHTAIHGSDSHRLFFRR